MGEWSKVDPGGDTWNYKEHPEIIGIYSDKKTDVGPNKSMMYHLKAEDVDIWIWGSTLIDKRFEKIEFGEEVKIVYLGDEKSPKTGRTYHNFEIYHRQPEGKKIIVEDEIDPEKIEF